MGYGKEDDGEDVGGRPGNEHGGLVTASLGIRASFPTAQGSISFVDFLPSSHDISPNLFFSV